MKNKFLPLIFCAVIFTTTQAFCIDDDNYNEDGDYVKKPFIDGFSGSTKKSHPNKMFFSEETEKNIFTSNSFPPNITDVEKEAMFYSSSHNPNNISHTPSTPPLGNTKSSVIESKDQEKPSSDKKE